MAPDRGASSCIAPLGELRRVGRVETGVVFEQSVEVIDKAGKTRLLRRVELHLDECTKEGHTVMQVLTTVPAEYLDASELARLFLQPGLLETSA